MMERAAALRGRMDSLDKHVHHAEQISFRQCVTFCEHGQLKFWRQHFQATEAKISISVILHYFVAFVARCRNKWPWRPETKKSSRNFTVTGMSMSCLDRARTANFGYTKLTAKNHSNPSLIHNSNIHPYDVRAGW